MDTALPPRISVIVPVHNAHRTLAQCLESLERQTDPGYEVIVGDDQSTDDSREIAKSISERAGFRLVELAVNKGQAVARNEGAKVATGEILAFVDANVVVPDDWLVRYRRLLDELCDVPALLRRGGGLSRVLHRRPAGSSDSEGCRH